MPLLQKEKNINKTPFSCRRGELNIRGSEYRPQGKKLPIVIISHGFMANSMTVAHYGKMLARMGYAAFCYDFCGGCVTLGKSDGETTQMSVLTEIEDLKAVIEYTKALPYTDENKVVLMGCSQGGFVSSLTAAELQDEISDLVLFYPAFCIPDDARKGKMMLAKFDPADIPEIINCGPMKLGSRYVSDVIDMNPYEKVVTYPGNVLVVHGTKDSIVALSYSERLIEAYNARSTGKAKLITIKGGGHMFSPYYDTIAMKHLKAYLKLD